MIAIAIGIAIAIEIEIDSDSDLDFAHLTNKKVQTPVVGGAHPTPVAEGQEVSH
jgi:hypothetical protein